MKLLPLIIPVVFALLRLTTGKYPFSALTTLSCAVLSALSGAAGRWIVTIALIISALGDYFMAHQQQNNFFLYGIAGFAVGHALLIAFSLTSFSGKPWPIVLILCMSALYAMYLFRRVLPVIDKGLRIPVLAYALISLTSLFSALCRSASGVEYWAYALGIFSILFSDTMIAEGEFVGTASVKWLILPTYYLSHICVTLGLMATQL